MKQAVTPVKMSFRHELRDTDEFGLPVGILGLHPDRFYGAIGRVVLVCAVLEDQVITLRHTLAGAQQGTFTREPVSSQIKAARGLARNLPEQDAQATERFLDTGAEALQRRNKLVDSSFPANPTDAFGVTGPPGTRATQGALPIPWRPALRTAP